MKFVTFEQLNEARLKAGFFMSELPGHLGVSKETFNRWKRNSRAPFWAVKIMTLESGTKCKHCLSRKNALRQYELFMK